MSATEDNPALRCPECGCFRFLGYITGGVFFACGCEALGWPLSQVLEVSNAKDHA